MTINITHQKHSGKVKFFNEEKGFGFIVLDNSTDEIFFHVSATDETLQKNDRVSFEVTQGKKGMMACNIKLGRTPYAMR
jgi:cold shock protein